MLDIILIQLKKKEKEITETVKRINWHFSIIEQQAMKVATFYSSLSC